MIVKEVLLLPQPTDALLHCRYYMTLLRDDQLQVRVGDCVYVTREGSEARQTLTPTTDRDSLDIFRVERLWKKYRLEKLANTFLL